MFKEFRDKVYQHFQTLLLSHKVFFLTDVSRDYIWETYLNSFPEGSNEIYQERTEHDCNTCKQFLRPYGNLVAVVNNKLVSIWDIEVDDPNYQEVANKLSEMVKGSLIANVFVSKESKLGTSHTHQSLEDGTIKTWNHFYLDLPREMVNNSSDSIESIQGNYRSAKEVFKRSLDEIDVDSINTTIELIEQGSIYRGTEFIGAIKEFLKYAKQYAKLEEEEKDNYCWVNSIKAGVALSKIRNSAIGTLLIDIAEGRELDAAVSAFERIMAPANYKRPTAIITKRMIEDARKKIQELGFENSLGRRHSSLEDITINNVLFANRDAQSAMAGDLFDQLGAEIAVDKKKFDRVDEVSINDFIENILPNASGLEVMVENSHMKNFVSLISPQNIEAPSMFKWDNGFSWAYTGDFTDSIKEKVKAAGGQVVGELRASLNWFNYDDLDLHCVEPDGNHIYYGNKCSKSSGNLDVDMNAGSGQVRDAVENIIWSNKNFMKEGKYKIYIHNFSKRETVDVGFVLELEHDGKILTYEYNKAVRANSNVDVVEFHYSKTKGIEIIKSIDSTETSREMWNIKTNQFHPVSVLMNSPNHWDDQQIGNKHYFFMLDGCLNDSNPRGFFNEFLRDDLMNQKKVFEALGSKMKVEDSDSQLSGLGFSSTKRDSLICKVTGSFERTIKIIF